MVLGVPRSSVHLYDYRYCWPFFRAMYLNHPRPFPGAEAEALPRAKDPHQVDARELDPHRAEAGDPHRAGELIKRLIDTSKFFYLQYYLQ